MSISQGTRARHGLGGGTVVSWLTPLSPGGGAAAGCAGLIEDDWASRALRILSIMSTPAVKASASNSEQPDSGSRVEYLLNTAKASVLVSTPTLAPKREMGTLSMTIGSLAVEDCSIPNACSIWMYSVVTEKDGQRVACRRLGGSVYQE